MNLFSVTFPVSDPGGDNKQLFLYKAPTDGHGGGVRLLEAYAVNGAATDAGTTFTFALHKYTNAGTPALSGTIAAAIGGTAAPWAAKVPKAFTVDSDTSFLDAGEWMVCQYGEVANGSPTLASVTCLFQVGK